MTCCCRENKLILKTKEMVVDFHDCDGAAVELVHSVRYLGVNLANINWCTNTTSLIKSPPAPALPEEAEEGRSGSRCPQVPLHLCGGEHPDLHDLLHGGREASVQKVKSAQRTTGCIFPSLWDIFTTRCRTRATGILHDSTHPALLKPLGRKLRCIQAKTSRLK